MNQRRLALASLLIAGGLAVSGMAQAWTWSFGSGERVAGSGETATETRSPGSFDGISLGGNFRVLVRQGSAETVEIKADKNHLPLIETRIVETSKGRVLEVGTKRGYWLQSASAPVLNIELKSLRTLSVAGAGDVKVEALKAPQLDASVAGSGDITLNELQVERLGLRVSGSGDVQASGRADSLSVAIAGSGDVKTANLQADEVKVSIAGSGDAQVHAVKRLKVSVAGSGDVRYRGDPQIDSSISGSGTVRQLGR